MNQHWLNPDWEPGLSISSLPINHFLERGIKALVLDVDKTLLAGREIVLQQSVKEWVEEAHHHFLVHLLSNNPSKKRIGAVAEQLGLNFTFGAAKPRRKALRGVLVQLKQNPSNIAMVGDRIFTDILAGNRLGLYTVLVRPLGTDWKPSKNNKIQLLEQIIANLLDNSISLQTISVSDPTDTS